MTSLFWAFVALVALAGWAFTLVALMRSLLPMASALSVVHKLDEHIDTRITKIIDRLSDRERTQRPRVPSALPSPSTTPSPADTLRDLLGSTPLEPIGDQPDLEILS